MDTLTKKQERILANIRKLDVESNKIAESLRHDGYTIKSQYNPLTNRDTLIISK